MGYPLDGGARVVVAVCCGGRARDSKVVGIEMAGFETMESRWF